MIARLFLLLLCLCSIVACGPSAQPADTAPADASTAPAPPPPVADVTPDEFRQLMKESDVVILDVRTPAETAGGTIDGAVEMDYRDPSFATRMAELDKDKTYLVYCASGGRSNSACEMMSEAGFGKLYNLAGGYTAWKGQ